MFFSSFRDTWASSIPSGEVGNVGESVLMALYKMSDHRTLWKANNSSSHRCFSVVRLEDELTEELEVGQARWGCQDGDPWS